MKRLICITLTVVGSMMLFGCADDPFDPGPVDAPSSMNKPRSMDSGHETIERSNDVNAPGR